jgi:hypothetical protein
MTRFTRIAAAALLGLGFAHAASAQGLRTVDDGNGIEVVGRDAGQNIVGGATYRVIGAGEGAVIEVIEAPVAQQGRVAQVVGSGENATVVTQGAAPASRLANAFADRG